MNNCDRAAAMRCREKRKTWVQELEMRARNMQATNHNLVAEVAALKSEVASLKTLLLAHRNCPVTQALAQESTHRIINLSVPAPTNEENTSQKKGPSTGNPIVIFNTTSTMPPRKRKHITNGIPTVPSSNLSLPKQLIPSSILQLAPASSIQLAPSSTIQLTESSNLPSTLHLATNSSPSPTIQLVRTCSSSSTIQIETIPSIVTHPSVGQANVACERNTPSVLVTKPAIQSTISLAFQPTNNVTPAIIIPKLCFTGSSGQKAVNGHLLGSSVTSQVIKSKLLHATCNNMDIKEKGVCILCLLLRLKEIMMNLRTHGSITHFTSRIITIESIAEHERICSPLGTDKKIPDTQPYGSCAAFREPD
ncbi:unnamed protein product [Timema podura]|uniref:BZIP domain-containing protein n=1 Tax=Timema podura TaxID=61482 RepID=A0ABN7NTG2_TIMPD|nr:unnamed protein product [Timema podura]